jgi:RNA polymerase sigma-70 factor (ECF subfamily)
LYELLKDRMFGMCLRYSHCREDAEDILQDGFIAVFRDFSQYKGDGPVEAWVRRVILNTALRHLRRQTKDIFIQAESDENHASDEITEEDHFEKEMMIQFLLKTIQQMPPGFRTVLNLYILEGHSHEQIAGYLGISPGTSKSQLNRAKEYLRKALARSLQAKG